MKFSLVCIVFCLFVAQAFGGLEPTKIEHDGIYKLEIQSEDKWLTGIENSTDAIATRSSWRNRQEQKWKFTKSKDAATGKDAWKIAPLDNVGALDALWQVKYVGHGKFQFINYSNGLCLTGPGSSRVVESTCQGTHDPSQRWLILPVRE